MNRRIFIIIVVFLFASVQLFSQESIDIDKTSGCDSLTVHFTLVDAQPLENYFNVVWIFGDGTTASNVLELDHLYTEPGVYDVRCELNDATRIIKASELIAIGSTPMADFIFRDSILDSEDFLYVFEPKYYTAHSNETLNYEWTFLHDGSVETDSVTTHVFPGDSVYTSVQLIVADTNMCADTIVKIIPVTKRLIVPNTFTPNHDGINDYFKVTPPGSYTYSLKIFSVRGTMVFSSTGPLIEWDGRTSDGREVPIGVYYYVIESADTPVETKESGFIHLFR